MANQESVNQSGHPVVDLVEYNTSEDKPILVDLDDDPSMEPEDPLIIPETSSSFNSTSSGKL